MESSEFDLEATYNKITEDLGRQEKKRQLESTRAEIDLQVSYDFWHMYIFAILLLQKVQRRRPKIKHNQNPVFIYFLVLTF